MTQVDVVCFYPDYQIISCGSGLLSIILKKKKNVKFRAAPKKKPVYNENSWWDRRNKG